LTKSHLILHFRPVQPFVERDSLIFSGFGPPLVPDVRIVREGTMQIRGIVRTATLEENPPGSDQIEMVLRVQGVGAGQPRLLVVPYTLLLTDQDLDPELIQGKGFQAEVVDEGAGRWIVSEITFASGRILRAPQES
jgi:hypothetical protein